MAGGRPPDPTRAKRGTGNRPAQGKAKTTTLVAVDPRSLPPAPPADLTHPHALLVWQIAVDELFTRGLKPADLEAIRMMAVQASRAHDAEAVINRVGMLIPTKRSDGSDGPPMVNPLLKTERDAARTYLTFAEGFGLDFVSRMRLGLMQLAGQSLVEMLSRELESDA